jgi:hypothetical protein
LAENKADQPEAVLPNEHGTSASNRTLKVSELVATSPANHIKNSVTNLWFVGYTNRVAIWVLDEAIATPRSGNFIQNSSKLDYFYSLVLATSPANHIESPVNSLWFVGYLNRLRDALSLFWFWMKQLQRQGASLLFKILDN